MRRTDHPCCAGITCKPSRWRDSNPPSPAYRAGARPVVLHRRRCPRRESNPHRPASRAGASSSWATWALPRLDSNQALDVQSVASYRIDDEEMMNRTVDGSRTRYSTLEEWHVTVDTPTA